MQTKTLEKAATLVVADRCDRCGAQAKIRASKDDMELLFCGHHIRVYEDALILQGFSLSE